MPPENAVLAEKVSSLEQSRITIWDTFSKEKAYIWAEFKEVGNKMTAIQVVLSSFGVLHTILLAWIINRMLKGTP